MIRVALSFLAALVFVLSISPSALAQSGQTPQGLHLPPLAEGSQGMGVPMKTEDQVNAERLQKFRLLRQEEMRKDMDNLAKLTQELKDYMDKNSSAVLSVDMIKKAEKMEKLAHNVRKAMTDIQ